MSRELSWNDMREIQLKREMDYMQNDTVSRRISDYVENEFRNASREKKRRLLKMREKEFWGE